MQGQPQVVVSFDVRAKEDAKATEEAGRPIFKDVEYIEKRIPGDTKNVIVRPIEEADKKEYALQYRAWKEGLADPSNGTPIGELPGISKSAAETLKHAGVRSIEDLSGLSDASCQALGAGTFKYRQQASDWIERAMGGAPDAKLRSELERRDSQIDALKAQIAELAERLGAARPDELAKALPAPVMPQVESPAKKPGRPRRTVQQEA